MQYPADISHENPHIALSLVNGSRNNKSHIFNYQSDDLVFGESRRGWEARQVPGRRIRYPT